MNVYGREHVALLTALEASALDRLPFDRLSAYWSSIAALWVLEANVRARSMLPITST